MDLPSPPPWLYDPNFIVAILGLILPIVLLFYRARPKKITERFLLSYIDAENTLKIEQRQFEITWGCRWLIFYRKLKLIELPNTTTFEITFKPLNGIETPLPDDCYTEKVGKFGRVIFLTNKAFFGERNINQIFILTKTPISSDYKGKISHKIYPSYLEVINENPIEIRNYRFSLPPGLELDRIVKSIEHIEHVRIEIPLPLLENVLNKEIKKCRESRLAVTVLLKKLPSKSGNDPGKIEIPLS